MSWLDNFLEKQSSALFVRVDEDYLQDSFNHFGLNTRMTNFRDAAKLLLSDSIPKNSDPKATKNKAAILYGQIHQRFLNTAEGLEKMYEKYKRATKPNAQSAFPKCPRVYCKNTCCLPYGVSDQPGECKLMFYCPNCNDVYKIRVPGFEKVDGAYFGPTYVHLFLQKYPSVIPNSRKQRYVPTVFGFRMCKEEDVEICPHEESD